MYLAPLTGGPHAPLVLAPPRAFSHSPERRSPGSEYEPEQEQLPVVVASSLSLSLPHSLTRVRVYTRTYTHSLSFSRSDSTLLTPLGFLQDR